MARPYFAKPFVLWSVVWHGHIFIYFAMFSFHDLMCCDVLRAASLQAVPAIADANKVQIAEHILPLWNTHVHYVPLYVPLLSIVLFWYPHVCSVFTMIHSEMTDSDRCHKSCRSCHLSFSGSDGSELRGVATPSNSSELQLSDAGKCPKFQAPAMHLPHDAFALPILLALKRLKSLGFLCLLGVFVLYFVNLLMLFCPCEKSSGIV